MGIVRKGCIDVPAISDEFGIQKYTDGLTKFILECNTPMTIAIQGDWGTGKTSIMEMVRNNLKKSISEDRLVWFNTWQYSQFDLGERLPILLVSKLITKLGGVNPEAQNQIKNILAGIINITTGILSQGATDGASLTNVLIDSDFSESYSGLKDSFQNLVNKRAPEEDGRVVVFVDDLDRLSPGRAVELLEVMKNFFDCEKCVFVLAIDYGVVLRGVKEKYGQDFDEEKGRSFFDKIIQVPFRMPTSSYNIANYVASNFKNIGISFNDKEIGLCVDLIQTSTGSNPRSMKRLFNAFLLLLNVAGIGAISTSKEQLMLFALLCMQSKFADAYDYIIQMDKEQLNGEFLKNLSDEEVGYPEEMNISTDEKSIEFSNFCEKFYEVIDSDNSRVIDDTEIKVLKKVLEFSQITATSSAKVSSSTRNYDRFVIDGDETEYKKSELTYALVKKVVDENASITIRELDNMFSWKNQRDIICLCDDIDEKRKKNYKMDSLITVEGKEYAVWKNWGASNHFDEYVDEKLRKIIAITRVEA